MKGADTGETVLIVSNRWRISATDRWESELSRPVEVVDPDDASLDVDERISGVIVELDDPETLRRTLVSLRDLDVPIVVAPRKGSEVLATIAMRFGATDYTSPDISDDPRDEIQTVLTEWRSRTADPTVESDRLHRIVATTLPDEAFVIDEDGQYLEATVRPESGDLYTIAADELVGRKLGEAFPAEEAARLQACLEETLANEEVQTIEYETDTTNGLRRFEAKVVPVDGRIGGKRAVVWLARDVTERAERERQLRRRRDRLETLNRINAIVRQVIQTLVDAPTRRAIEREVCDHLVESDLYTAAWIVEHTGEDVLSYRMDDANVTCWVDADSDLAAKLEAPALAAIETDEIQSLDQSISIESADDCGELPAEGNELAGRTAESLLAVPLSYDGAVYGALVILASRNDAFDVRECEAFRVLGETIGFAISALKNRRLLFSDTVVELELYIPSGDSFSFEVTERYNCTGSLEWAGTTSDGRTYQYVTYQGIDGETIYDEASGHDSIEECRLIHDGESQCTIEFRLRNSAVRMLANHGVWFRNITVEDGEARLIAEVSRDANVREVVEELTRIYDDATLVARREIDRPVQTAGERRQRILETLTDRQLAALRIAYYSGYFEWPRGSTGEDIAETMGITPPTLHQHLRKGLWELLHEFFEGGGDIGPPSSDDE